MNINLEKCLPIFTFLALITLLFTVSKANAVDNNGLFELEGNAIDDPVIVGDDWSVLHSGGGSASTFTGVISDLAPLSIFTGGRKDIQDVSEWKHKEGSVPDKDDLTNAYAAAYVNGVGDLIAYFGADRYANNGDAYMGFWFFKEKVEALPDGSFSGNHQVGDILVLIVYPQGANATPQVDVVEWNPAEADVANNLKLLFSGAMCDGTGGLACAITNAADQGAPWPYTPKDGVAGTFPYESFFEGGINITQLLGGITGETPCYSSFMAETRSSASFTATLKDFVLGEFNVCSISVQKSCNVTRLTTADDATDRFFVAEFNAVVTNSGAGLIPAGTDINIHDDAGTPADPSDDVYQTLTLVDAMAPGGFVNFTGSFFTNQNPPVNTIQASTEVGGAMITSDSYSVECSPLALNSAIDVSKNCDITLEATGGILAVKKMYSGQICNNSDVPMVVTVTDDKVGMVFGPTEMAVGTCELIAGSYLPGSTENGSMNPSTASFQNTFTATATSDIPSVPDAMDMATATCDLCPAP